MDMLDGVALEHHQIQTNGITLHVVAAGPEDGRLVLLLHGFPEFWYGWRHQIPALVAAGYRVIVPDQRGYNLSDKPKGVASYAWDNMAVDAVGLITAFGRQKAIVVGHDWGANVAWWVGMAYPQHVEKLVVMNVPHPLVFMQTLRSNWRQMLKSWYIFFFQLPFMPEFSLSRRDYAPMVTQVQGSANPGTFTDADMAHYREAWRQPGALTAMINWYRAALRKLPRLNGDPRLSVPTLLIWGKQDRFLSDAMAQPSIDMCDGGRLVMLDEATHWVQHDLPARVNSLLLDFLSWPIDPPDEAL